MRNDERLQMPRMDDAQTGGATQQKYFTADELGTFSIGRRCASVGGEVTN